MEHLPSLAAWDSFYVIVGSSAAALTGLQFVVITLIGAEEEPRSGSAELGAFGTPTVVHFCAAFLIASILSAPWHTLASVALVMGACGIAGVLYTGLVIRRARRTTQYQPVLEDWIWHAVLPFLAYACVLGASVALRSSPRSSLFVIGGAAIVLLFVGIHNAWDTVMFVTVERLKRKRKG
jgi:hypothetical protein